MGLRSRVEVDVEPLRINVETWGRRQQANVTAAAQFIATEGETYMKVNAPWNDQTTAARSGLHSLVVAEPNRWQIIFAHSVSYGIWLEVKNSGKYEIILPTLRHEVDRLRTVLAQFFGR